MTEMITQVKTAMKTRTKSDIPEDLDPPEVDVTDKSYAIDLSTAEWVKPEAGLITGFLGDALDVKVLMAVEEANDDTLDLVGALPEGPGKRCFGARYLLAHPRSGPHRL